MPTNRLRKHARFLAALRKAAPTQRGALLRKSSNGEICSICEISKNITNGAVHISPTRKRQLCKFKKFMRVLNDRKKSIKSKRNALVRMNGSGGKKRGRQRGGIAFLPMLIGGVTSLLGSLLNKGSS